MSSKGSYLEIIRGLSSLVNFHRNLTFLRIIYENGSSTGAKRIVVENEVDFSLCFYYITLLNLKYVAISEAYFMVPLVIMVPSETSSTTLQRFYVPFLLELWIAFLIIIIIALFIITIVEFRFSHMREFIIGNNIEHP